MAYGTKYRFTFESTNGTTYRILIQKDGYSGTIKDRPLGRAPVLKRKHSDHIYGTSLEIYAECEVDGEFAELYTSSPTEYRVQLYSGNTLRWSGFVSPELYSEPDIAPPYDVQIVATDGLGELKLHTFQGQGNKSLQALFAYLLSFTGLDTSINYVSNLAAKDSFGSTVSVSALWNSAVIDIDHMAGKSCYDVLQYLLTTLCASITYQDVQWLIWRDNDATSSQLSSKSVGSMGSGGLWPIGNLVSRIEPAKKRITVEAPFHRKSRLINSDMTSDIGWTKHNASYEAEAKAYKMGLTGTISQTINVIDMSVGLAISTQFGSAVPTSEITGRYGELEFTPEGSNDKFVICDKNDGNGPQWFLTSEVWPMDPANGWKYDIHITIGAQGTAPETTMDLPAFDRQGYSQRGTLTVLLWGRLNTLIYNFYLYRPVSKGFRDIIFINNDARGDGNTVEIAQGRVTSEMVDAYYGYLQGVFEILTSRFVTDFADRCFPSYSDFLSLTAKNYARLVALPRLRFSGRLDTPSNFGAPPVLLSKGGIDYLLETFSWDILNDEMDVEAISLPSGTLTIDSETVTDITSESSTGGGGGGGGAAPSGGTTVTWGTAAEGYRPLSVAGDESSVALLGHTHAASAISGLAAVATSGSYSDLSGKPDLTNYLQKVTGATGDHLASLTSAGAVEDSGIAKTNVALLNAAQTFTGQNTFSEAVNISAGMLKLRNLSAVANDGQGTFIFNQGNVATCDFRAGTAHKIYVDDTQKFEVNASRVRSWVPVSPAWDGGQDIGESSLRWNNLHVKRWYPNGASGPYIEFDTTTNAFYIHGNLVASGFISAGAGNPNA